MKNIYKRTSYIGYNMLTLLTHENNIIVVHQGANPHFQLPKLPKLAQKHLNSRSRIFERKNDSTERFFSSERCSPEFIVAANESLQRARKFAVPSMRTGAVLPKMN